MPGVVGGRDIDGLRPTSVGMLEEREGVLVWPLELRLQRSLITTTSGFDWMFCGRSVRLPIFLDNIRGEFSFWLGEPVLYIEARFRSMMPPATGILVGEGVLGDELNFEPLRSIDIGELPRVAAAIKLFRSDRELRLFFLSDLVIS